MGFYTLSHIFVLLEWRMLVSGLCVSVSGFFFGGILAWVMRLNKAQIIAVSMETALQNGNIAFILLKVSIPMPFSDIAALPPIAQILMSSCILYLLYAIHKIYGCCKSRSKDTSSDRKTGKGVEKPLMNFHGGELISEFAWAKRSSLIVTNAPSADSSHAV